MVIRYGLEFGCGCCGYPATMIDQDVHHRCEKHVRRIPCIVDGCGRTFSLDPEEDYKQVSLCGKHWRMAPKALRDKAAAVRKIANKRGWTEGRKHLYSKFWWECANAVLGEDTLVPEEINKMFGWDAE